MGWDFAHFFFGAEVDGQVGYILLQDSRQPLAPFVSIRIAQASFDTDW